MRVRGASLKCRPIRLENAYTLIHIEVLDGTVGGVYSIHTNTRWTVMGRTQHSIKTRDVTAKLRGDGWTIVRKGPGDHVQYKHATRPGRVTIDMGAREIPTGTLRSIYRQAGWEW
jgi:predicted RNA binding protein YcfA (HicA-like mRNA interferase family)